MFKIHFPWLIFLFVALMTEAVAQFPAGSIEGIVKDESGAVLEGVRITITEESTQRRRHFETAESGFYAFSSLPPGTYAVEAQLQGFQTALIRLEVRSGPATPGNLVLRVGAISDQIQVDSALNQVDVSSHTVAGFVTGQEVRALPLQGRQFLDAVQSEPGAQLVDSATLPASFLQSKRQFSGASFAGRTGGTTRITVDGVDINDEVAGSIVQNLSIESVQEFRVSQSSLDPSTTVTSSAAVGIVTRKGGNQLHGSAFLFHRDDALAALPVSRNGDERTLANIENAQFDRQQAGLQLGGPIKEDRLFFFSNYEYINQDGATFVFSEPFPQWNGPVETPFNAHMALGRLDWNLSSSISAFSRYSHETNAGADDFGGPAMAPRWSHYVSNIAAAGIDFFTGRQTHSFRYAHTKFQNNVTSRNLGLPEFKAANGVSVTILEGTHLGTSPYLVPQTIFQTNDQARYDGTWVQGSHTLRFGLEVNFIRANIHHNQFGDGPAVFFRFSEEERQRIQNRGGNPQNPLEYPVSFVPMGNGFGYFTEMPSHDRPFGGVNNTRLGAYLADHWRVNSALSLNFGLRYGVDTGLVNDDLGLPQELATVLGPQGIQPTRRDTNNFAPQAGFAWQPFNNSRTVIRGGVGVYYGSHLLLETVTDRSTRLPSGLGSQSAFPPFGGIDEAGRVVVSGIPVNNFDTRKWSGAPILSVIDQIGQTFADFQSATLGNGYTGTGPAAILTSRSTDLLGSAIIAQDSSTPYTLQMNLGVQWEIRRDWVVSADFVRHRSLHHGVYEDVNRSTPDRIDAVSAEARIDQVLASRGYASIDEAIDQGLPFRFFGLSSFYERPDPAFYDIILRKSEGTSTYKALQLRLRGRLTNPFRGLRALDLLVGYAFGNYSGPVEDQDGLGSYFQDNLVRANASGPTGLDRRHLLTLQFNADLRWGFKLSLRQLMRSSLPTTLELPFIGNPEFTTDIDGDGRADLFPSGKRGAFGRDIDSVEELNSAIVDFNATKAGQLTAKGRTLVQAGLFTEDQLRRFGMVIPTLQLAPSNQVFNDSFITTDIRFGKEFRIGENIRMEPLIEVFNLFNIGNYQKLSGALNGSHGSANGTPPEFQTRVGLGSGSFGQGIPRAFQLALRVSF